MTTVWVGPDAAPAAGVDYRSAEVGATGEVAAQIEAQWRARGGA